MTRVFQVDSNNDLMLAENNNLAIADGLTATMQACEQAARAQINEMVLNVDEGMPNFQVVWVGAPNLQQFEAYLMARLLTVDGVTDVESIESSVSSGVLSYTATIKTIYGNGVING